MTRLAKASWQSITSLVETLEGAGMSAEDAEGLTADNPLLVQFVDDVKRQRRERARLERAELAPSVEVTPGSPVTLEEAFFPKGRFAYEAHDKSVRARIVNALDRALKYELRDGEVVYVTDLCHISREGLEHLRNVGATSREFIERVMSAYEVAFADPADPEMIPTGSSSWFEFYFSRNEILDVKIERLGLSLGYQDVTNGTTLGQYLRMEVSARDDFYSQQAQQVINEFVARYNIGV